MSEMSGRDQRYEIGEEFDPMGEHIQTIAELHKRAERDVPLHQRKIEEVTAFLGRPRFLFIILVVVVLWAVVNIMLITFGGPRLDPPPFVWLQGLLTLAACRREAIACLSSFA